jgi:tRNA threonylcarbamoyladenosine biosynthesis protein TsaB
MKLVALDTSTEACSVAVSSDGDVYARFELAPREHTRLMLPMLESVLAEAGISIAQLDAIAFGRGPGSFTGVRIAASIAQGLALSHDLPMVPISTLMALAQAAKRLHGSNKVMTAIDARMQEVYWSCFELEHGLMRAYSEECVCKPGAVDIPEPERWDAAGSGWKTYREVLEGRAGDRLAQCYADLFPSAEDIARLAERDFVSGCAVDVADAVPVYLRDNVARKRGEK